ncbi:MAG: type II secretion system F family protein [Candidatus Gracilibacteria bacterium]|jgi:type IV pilus assembly protein PilC
MDNFNNNFGNNSTNDALHDEIGSEFGQVLLTKIKQIQKQEEDNVIYGVYDNSDKGIFVRINDFLIDRSKVSLKEKSYFFHMLAVMVDAGVPVVTGLKHLAKHAENIRFRRILNTIAYDCERGFPFSDAMTRFDDVFDEADIGIIRAGEVSGKLNSILFKLSEQLDKRHDLSMKIFSASIYPIAVLIVLVVVSIALIVFVLPTLLNLLKEGGITGDKLPFATRVMIFLQQAVYGYWIFMLFGLAALYGIFVFFSSTEKGSTFIDYIKLRIFVVGSLYRKVYVLKFVSMMGLLVDAGIPVLKSISITGNAIVNKIYRIKVNEILKMVKDGKKISEGMEDSEFLFPPDVVQMIRVGESTASLSVVCEKVANQYQREVDNSLKKMTALFEPLMILFVGMFVALIALSIMAPIFNLGQSVSLS